MKKINLIQTGGTIAMSRSEGITSLDPEKWSQTLYREIPELVTIAEIHMDQLFLEDSSDVNLSHWESLSQHIVKHQSEFDGFVILHGTDTMAYTASALSFSLLGLEKPVILTGSQVPMSMLRSDAKRNLVNAVELSTLPIPEVAICFHDTLFRGNRATKMSISDFNAFESPNFPPLVKVGLEMEVHHHLLLKKSSEQIFHFFSPDSAAKRPLFSPHIFVLKLFPGLSTDMLMSLPFEKTEVILLEAFGSGNFPTKGNTSILPFLEEATQKGIHVIITSQAPFDAVDLSNYESGHLAQKLGVLSARDMTIEAAVTKSMFLLAHLEGKDKFKDYFTTPLAGEITA